MLSTSTLQFRTEYGAALEITDSVLGTFTPAIADTGLNTVTYYYDNCAYSVEYFVVFTSAGNDRSSCPTQSDFNLVGFPASGIWNGSGIIDVNLGTFSPPTAVIGNINLTYTVFGCMDTMLMRNIMTDVIDTQYICLGLDSILLDQALTSSDPSNGIWSGLYVSQDTISQILPSIKPIRIWPI